MKLVALVLVPLSLLGFAAGQQFPCPTHSPGCDSYEELLNAKDPSIASPEVRYACFRDASDEFFVIKAVDPLLLPSLWWKWNPTLATYVPNFAADSSEVSLEVATFSNGVEDDSRMPYIYAQGKWLPMFGNGLHFFGSSRRYDSKTSKWIPNRDATASVDDSQVSVELKYDSQTNKKVEYSLTMQRSTKRFKEAFNVIGDPKADFDNTGRCVEVKPMPTLPDPPVLTDEQKDEQQKKDFCLDYSKLSKSEAGYCLSSFTYIEDYEAAQKKKAAQKATH